ncbi:dethiobiotin synthase [Desulfotalea psychrophila]|uniref:ATP-dependent dethiobiotin synthetase BioD n=1 Tax=Desulfotalea psychrophila (strain LSv54 / DSM 12343) TaxID=177439 RepID=Q6AK53_DESPS|nr:dethiobiotin synthase [Desulfotalea psychrophila]CAG37273.1 probable dethiobiotin synthase (BioD) [Desulfotalea psychrophila LSv54]
MAGVYFVTGIDTDIGKTFCTGLMAAWLAEHGRSVITSKLVQTGCVGISEDILAHRQIMGIDPLAEDRDGRTCSYVFKKPCSPHLAAAQEGVVMDLDLISENIDQLARSYQTVLVEGAGGLCAPVTREVSSLDYVLAHKLPLLVVTSSRLGSLHHSLCLLEVLQQRGGTLAGMIYNRYGEVDREIGNDSRQLIAESMKKYGFSAPLVDIVADAGIGQVDFSAIF